MVKDEEFEEIKKNVEKLQLMFSTSTKKESIQIFINGKYYNLTC